jgi:HAD superfamily hydrolase (TIGR01458 family)
MLPILIDFDGVIKLGNKPAPDTDEFLKFLAVNRIPSCIISNSTLRTGDLIKEFFSSHGIELKIPALTAFDATLAFVKKRYKRVQVHCRDYLLHHFKDILDEENPEVIVIGNIEDRWNYKIVNDIFKKVFKGAELIAMHKNKYWSPHGELLIDAGAFVKAIEYSSGKEAVLIGKPSPIYFQSALGRIRYPADSKFLMIGDDIETDIGGAQACGGKGILIYTGKTKYLLSEEIKIKPDFEARNLAEVIEILKQIL